MLEVSNDEATSASNDGNNSASSDISGGYHSDSDSTIMMSGNSPFVSKSAKYNFLQRSGMFFYFFNMYIYVVFIGE